MPQKFVSQPSDKCDGSYVIAKWDEHLNQYQVIETNLCKDAAIERAKCLCEEYIQEIYELEHQTEMISKAHEFILSENVQKQNAAKEFLRRSKYQSDTCNETLKEHEEK